jgi:uncharacterized protein YndB with AHSA1/START domain
MSTTDVVSPIVRTITVDAPPERAFRVFTEEIGSWWPVAKYSVGQEQAETAVLEPRLGGRIYEQWQDGTEALWGEILVWEPPWRLVYSWKPNQDSAYEPTEVEVSFEQAGERTRVVVEHRGWEVLGELAAEARSSYESGWPGVLEAYEAAI